MYQKLCTKVTLWPSPSGSHSLGLILSIPDIRIGLLILDVLNIVMQKGTFLFL